MSKLHLPVFVGFMMLFQTSLLGQLPVLKEMADDVCSCIQNIKSRSLNERAELCLQRVAGGYEQMLLDSLDISIRSDGALAGLIDTLAAPLSRRCPELADFVYGDVVQQRWSDAPRQVGRGYLYTFSPPPPVLDTGMVSGEVALERVFSGNLVDLVPSGELTLDVGERIVVVYLPDRLRNTMVWARGRDYRLACVRVHSKVNNRLQYEVTEVLPASEEE